LQDGKWMKEAQKCFVIRSVNLEVTLPVSLIILDIHILEICCKQNLEAQIIYV
jgi:hypothetical protein